MLEQCHWYHPGVFIVNLEQISHCSGVSIVDNDQVNAGLDTKRNHQIFEILFEINVLSTSKQMGRKIFIILKTPAIRFGAEKHAVCVGIDEFKWMLKHCSIVDIAAYVALQVDIAT